MPASPKARVLSSGWAPDFSALSQEGTACDTTLPPPALSKARSSEPGLPQNIFS